MESQNLGVSQLARKVGISHPTIIDLVTHGKRPSFDTCIALSNWLGQSPVLTLYEAGLLPVSKDNNLLVEDWKHLLAQLSEDEQEEIKQIAILKIEKRKKKK